MLFMYGYKYRCIVCVSGKNCEVNFDDCKDNPCINGATCEDGLNNFVCRCKPGYTGMDFTELKLMVDSIFISTCSKTESKNLRGIFVGFLLSSPDQKTAKNFFVYIAKV